MPVPRLNSLLMLGLAWCLSCVPCLLLPAAEPDDLSLADRLPRLPPVEPEQALDTFAVQQGFHLELVAHEPIVSDPVDACFDERGRLFVAEMHGYPFSSEIRIPQQPEPIGKHNAGIIRLLEDTTGDGQFDRSIVFADGISWPTSVCCYDGGLFVLAPEHLYYFKDTDGDDIADVREIVWTGFSRFNVQGLANNLKWGLDGRIYAAGGTNGGDLLQGDRAIGSLRGKDFSFDPWTRHLRWETGGQQFGHAFNDWGQRFVCSNSNHIQQVIYPYHVLERTSGVSVGNPVWSIAVEGPAAPVFRRSPPEPWRIVRTERRASDPAYRDRLPSTELVAVGFFTSATGVTIYRGDAYPVEFQGNAFIGDVGGNLVHRKHLFPHGVAYQARRAEHEVEFITSTDTWFRPVNFVNGPDGCLYILDMYRETIEHPFSIPEDIKAHLDLESGNDRGRIYRLVPPGWEPRPLPNLADADISRLVEHLHSGNAWHRETAHRLLLERNDPHAWPLVASMLIANPEINSSTPSPNGSAERDDAVAHDALTALSLPDILGQLHALSLLDRVDRLHREHLLTALRSPDPRLQSHAVRFIRSRLTTEDAELLAELQMLSLNGDPQYLFELALACGDFPIELKIVLMRGILDRERLPPGVQEAVLTAIGSDAQALLDLALQDSDSKATGLGLLRQLVTLTIAEGDDELARRIMSRLWDRYGPGNEILSLLDALETGQRRRGASLVRTLTVDDDPAWQPLRELLDLQARRALDESAAIEDRRTALGSLRYAPGELVLATLPRLLNPAVPGEIQSAVIDVISAHPDDDLVEPLFDAFPSLSPALRSRGLQALFRSRVRQERLIAALSEGVVRTGDLSAEQRQQLLNSPYEPVREAAVARFTPVTTDERAALIERYRADLEGGHAERGLEVFRRHCAQCHRVADMGHTVGPDLVSVSNKSPEDLLIAILDPNREAQANYSSYTAVTVDGQIITGLIVADTGSILTLRQAEGKETTLARQEIEELLANGTSLMPDGLDRQLTSLDVADVITWIRDLRPADKP